MKKPIVFMFAGQGSHYYQMARNLLPHPVFQHWLSQGESLMKASKRISLLEVLYNSPCQKGALFDRTLLTHPSIFVVGYALAQVLISENIRPDFVLGTSLGEFTALAVAGHLSFETALEAVINQAQLIEKHCSPAHMVAVIAPLKIYKTLPELYESTFLAAVNFEKHFVVSIDHPHLSRLQKVLTEQNISFQVLAVSHGFHAHYIDAAASYFLQATQSLRFQAGIPVISCKKADFLAFPTYEHLWECIREPILFQSTIEHLELQGQYNYLDVSPMGSLATFVKYLLLPSSSSKAFAVMSPFQRDSPSIESLKKALFL